MDGSNAGTVTPITVVEHPVLFKMPCLNNNKELEKIILDSLDELKTKFPNLISLSTGRLLKEEEGCTHAIYVRFPSYKALVDYYASDALMDVIKKMMPALTGEYTVDYNAFIEENLLKEHQDAVVHICFFKVKEGTSAETVEEAIKSIYNLHEEMPNIVLQIGAGANNYVRDKTFSHAFVARLASEKAVEEFYTHPSYSKVMEEKIKPNSNRVLSADFVPYSSVNAGPRL